MKTNVYIHRIIRFKSKTKSSNRFLEIDILRGFAIIFMIFLHILWDLDYFGLFPLNHQIYQFQKIVPFTFFLLVGICLAIHWDNKFVQKTTRQIEEYYHIFLRGIKIFSLGMLLTLITMIFIPDRPIVFGVLHCIGLSIILSIPFLHLKMYNLLIAPIIILIGLLLDQCTVENPNLFQLMIGLHQSKIAQYTIDYFPIFPWLGVSLFGISIGNFLYCGNSRRFYIPEFSSIKPVSLFSWLGRHSLTIYLIHQPIIAGFISFFTTF